MNVAVPHSVLMLAGGMEQNGTELTGFPDRHD